MRYFTVEREVMRATPVCYTVARDGSQLADDFTDEAYMSDGECLDLAIELYDKGIAYL